MIEPVQPISIPTPELPERLQKIIHILEMYKQNLIHNTTIINQNPRNTNSNIKILSRSKGNALIDYLKYNNILEENKKDPEFMEVIHELDAVITPWTSEISTLTPYYIKLMFIEMPLSANVNLALNQATKNYTLVDVQSTEKMP